MPISKYFKGHGEEVMQSMMKEYGPKGKSIFYATANKKGQKPAGHNKKRRGDGLAGHH